MEETKTKMLEGCEAFLNCINIMDYRKAMLNEDVYVYHFSYNNQSRTTTIELKISIYADAQSNICKIAITDDCWADDPIITRMDREIFNNPGFDDSIFGKTSLASMETCPASRRNQLYYVFTCSCLDHTLISTQLYTAFKDMVKEALMYHRANVDRNKMLLSIGGDSNDVSDDMSSIEAFTGDSNKLIN